MTMKVIDRANAAKRLKESDDFKAIMNCLEEDVFRQFRTAKVGDAETIANIHAISHGLTQITKSIEKFIEIAIFEASKAEN
jgi:hypothetical protein